MMRLRQVIARRARWVVAAVAIAAPLLAATASSASPAAQAGLRGVHPAQVNVTQDLTHRYGEPEIAVNPENPDNLVYVTTEPARLRL